MSLSAIPMIITANSANAIENHKSEAQISAYFKPKNAITAQTTNIKQIKVIFGCLDVISSPRIISHVHKTVLYRFQGYYYILALCGLADRYDKDISVALRQC